MEKTEIAIDQIITDEEIQPRTQLEEDVITEYYEKIDNGEIFPPVDVFYDGERYWLADGFHRYNAYKLLKRETIEAIVHDGGKNETLLHAAGSNATHGLRRTNADKNRVVELILKHSEFGNASDRQIAEWCRVSQPFVGKIRKKLVDEGHEFSPIRKCANKIEMDISKIGKKETDQPPIVKSTDGESDSTLEQPTNQSEDQTSKVPDADDMIGPSESETEQESADLDSPESGESSKPGIPARETDSKQEPPSEKEVDESENLDQQAGSDSEVEVGDSKITDPANPQISEDDIELKSIETSEPDDDPKNESDEYKGESIIELKARVAELEETIATKDAKIAECENIIDKLKEENSGLKEQLRMQEQAQENPKLLAN